VFGLILMWISERVHRAGAVLAPGDGADDARAHRRPPSSGAPPGGPFEMRQR